MIDDELVLRVERLRDSLLAFRVDLRRRYKLKTSRVMAADVRKQAAMLAEPWLADISARQDVRAAIAEETFADLNVAFQRLLTNSEHETERKSYDQSLASVLNDFGTRVVVPLKKNRGVAVAIAPTAPTSRTRIASVFIGQSFSKADEAVNKVIGDFLDNYGLKVVTGKKPSGTTISAKVRSRIESCDLFVGVFTRAEKIAGSDEWTTSAWVVDEKAYASAKGKLIILIKEEDVNSIGGIQGDIEYLEFDRSEMAQLLVKLIASLRDLDAK
jgi:hypothetical protein